MSTAGSSKSRNKGECCDLSFDGEIRRYLREGIIKISPNADVPEMIKAGKMLIRGQRNPMLDRTDFYNRQQGKKSCLVPFMKELYNMSDFSDLNLCQRCSTVICGQCGGC